MRIYSDVRKLRIQHDGNEIRFVDGVYEFDILQKREVYNLVETVKPETAIIKNQLGDQINKPEKPKKGKGEVSNADTDYIRPRKESVRVRREQILLSQTTNKNEEKVGK